MEFVELICPQCKHTFTVECPAEFEDGELVVKIGMFDDICPVCGTQAEVNEEAENQSA